MRCCDFCSISISFTNIYLKYYTLLLIHTNKFMLQLIDVNIKGVANIIRSFVPKMVAKNRGIIVNFSSGWGRSVAANVAPYCTSKWAIEGLSLALAEELPSNMASIPVNPGIINTEMLEVCFGDSAANFPSPQQWAEKAIAFLLGLTHKNNGQKMTI